VTPTNELREELRELIDEVVPFDGVDSDTRFTDAQLNRVLARAKNINAAAADGWTRKAAMLQRELNGLQGYSVGQEKYDFVRLKDALEYAFKMVEFYRQGSGPGSLILGVTPPAVL
jgi:hypothetical protein